MAVRSLYEKPALDQQPAPQPLPPVPTLETYLEHLTLLGGPSARKAALMEARDRTVERVLLQFETSMDAKGLQKLPPKERLAWYRALPLQNWLDWKARFTAGKYGYPKAYADYQDLRQREINGEFND